MFCSCCNLDLDRNIGEILGYIFICLCNILCLCIKPLIHVFMRKTSFLTYGNILKFCYLFSHEIEDANWSMEIYIYSQILHEFIFTFKRSFNSTYIISIPLLKYYLVIKYWTFSNNICLLLKWILVTMLNNMPGFTAVSD